ncbi:MAG: hypothetical protein H7Z74_00285 [Anaerolineae bacterium]|nr:hypothetical protein [Gemmatimonadaceae bacterium]
MKARHTSIISLALYALTACPPDQAAESSAKPTGPIFRYVQLNIGRVNLAEQLPADVRAAASVGDGDTVVALPRGSFAGAERITLYLDSGGRVRGAIFDYPTRLDFEALVREYASLGTPSRARVQRRGEEPSDVVSWQDTLTSFRLRRDPNRSAWTVRGELWDRELGEGLR